jgi:3-phenylpropionate/trans-cinnamate dioxygenase ferredoxin subunit
MNWWKEIDMTEMIDTEYKYYQIAPMNEIPVGERLFFEIEGQSIVLFATREGIFATGDVCSHDHGAIGDGELEGFEIICPRHGARFDIRTGKVLRLPAVKDIPHYPVREVDGMIEVGVVKR